MCFVRVFLLTCSKNLSKNDKIKIVSEYYCIKSKYQTCMEEVINSFTCRFPGFEALTRSLGSEIQWIFPC